MEVVNVVSTASLNCVLDLGDIVYRLSRVIYNPTKFSGLIWRHPKICGTLLLFKNRRLVHAGSRSIDSSKKHIRQYSRILQKMNNDVRITNFRIQTITSVIDLKKTLNLAKLSHFIPNASFEPELFPTVMFRQEGMHFSITRRGKIIITGGKSIKAMAEELDSVLLLIEISA